METSGCMRRILCPTDLSASSGVAVGLAVELARAQQAELALIHVDEALAPESLLAAAVASARERGVRAEGAVLDGDVVERILERAEAWRADVIVMGTRGQRRGRGWHLGSVVERVLLGARCPVLITTTAADGRPASSRPPRRILCPSDFSTVSARALESAVILARAWQARITLLHVLEGFAEHGNGAHVRIPEYQMDVSQATRERMRRAVPPEARQWCEDELVVAVGRAHEQILRVARERRMDLIVLGVHGQRALDRSLAGATVSHVVREACCPVLAVRIRRAAGAGDTGDSAPERRAS